MGVCNLCSAKPDRVLFAPPFLGEGIQSKDCQSLQLEWNTLEISIHAPGACRAGGPQVKDPNHLIWYVPQDHP